MVRSYRTLWVLVGFSKCYLVVHAIVLWMTSLELVGLNIEGRALFLRSMPLLVLRSSRCDQVIDMVCIWMTTMDKRSKLVYGWQLWTNALNLCSHHLPLCPCVIHIIIVSSSINHLLKEYSRGAPRMLTHGLILEAFRSRHFTFQKCATWHILIS